MSTLPKGITRDDTEHGALYFTKAQMREAMAQAESLRARVAELEAKLAEAGKDAARIDYLEEKLQKSLESGFRWDTIAYETDRPIREQLSAAIAAKEQPNASN